MRYTTKCKEKVNWPTIELAQKPNTDTYRARTFNVLLPLLEYLSTYAGIYTAIDIDIASPKFINADVEP